MKYLSLDTHFAIILRLSHTSQSYALKIFKYLTQRYATWNITYQTGAKQVRSATKQPNGTGWRKQLPFMSLVARQTSSRTQCAYCVEEPRNCLMRDTSWHLCYCSPPLRIINHNRSTWCWGKGFSRAGGGTPQARVSLLTKRVRTATSPCASHAAPLSRLCLFTQHQLLPSLFFPAFNVPPSPRVNLLLQ